MKTKGKLNKGVAYVLSAALLMGLAPSIPDIGIKSYADTAIDMAPPSIQAYVTKETLVSNDRTVNKFIPDADGKNDIVGLLYFGKASSEDGAFQKWYILGPDDGVTSSKENTVIFAATELTTVVFRGYTSDNPKWSDAKDGDYSGFGYNMTTNTELYKNHYGVSDIRKKTLQTMVSDSLTNFTENERNLLQLTKVKTSDYKNKIDEKASYYTTEDKLYLASRKDGDTNIYVGSSSDEAGKGIKLSASTYWKKIENGGLSSKDFWLRSPRYDISTSVFYANPSDGSIISCASDLKSGVRPASNLDLSSVLFASAADAASDDEKGDIIETSGTNQAAMILRLDGSKQNIGTFTYNKDGITVTKDTTEGDTVGTTSGVSKDIFLVVQGKTAKVEETEGTDWYYSKKIKAAEETVSLDTIATKVGIDKTKIDLTSANCKIWLETPVGDADKLCYAVTDGTKQHVHEYPTNKATPSELMKSDEASHWWQCTAEECPDSTGSIMNMTGEVGQKDAHNWVKSQEDADKNKTSFETYFKDKEEFLKDDTGNVEHKLNDEDNTKHDKITTITYYYYCQDCKYVDKGHTFTYEEKEEEDHKYTEENNGYTSLPDKHYKECNDCGHISDEGVHKYDDDKDRYCNDCGYERGHKHYPLKYQDELKPTCTVDGNIGYYYCGNGCDFKSKDSIGITPITKQATILKATGHKAAASSSYESDSSEHWKICENEINGETCGERFEVKAHRFSGNKCLDCGYPKSSGGSSSGGDSSSGGGSSSGGSGGSKNSERYKTDTSGSGLSNDSASGKAPNIIYSESWSQDASGRWWYHDGNTKVIGWAYDKTAGKWYYVDESKGMFTGWFYDNEAGYWYYLDNNTGEMLTGWQLIGGKQYYFALAPEAATYAFDASSSRWVYSNAANYRPYGSMYAGTITPDNQRVDTDGARIQ